jgi:hypothetical protein
VYFIFGRAQIWSEQIEIENLPVGEKKNEMFRVETLNQKHKSKEKKKTP